MESRPSRQQLSEGFSISLSRDTDATTYNDSSGAIRYPLPHMPIMDPEGPNSSSPSSSTIDNGRSRVLKLRERVKNLRLQIQEQRAVVQSKRETKADVDEQYIKMIRKRHVRYESPAENGSELTALEELWRKCQAARDAYGPAEDSLNIMEDRLETEEAKLSQAEEQFYVQLSLPRYSPAPESPNGTYDDPSDQGSVDSEPEYEPLYEEYLRRLGNQDLLLESYGGLINEKNRLEAEQLRRRRVGLDLSGEDLEFLVGWADTVEPVRKELDEVTKDVERLRKMCVAQGLIDDSGPPTQLPETREEQSQISDDHSQSEEDSTQSKAPQPQKATSNNEASSSPYISYEQDFGDNVNVNSWLLDKLRSSSHEIALLASFVFHEANGTEAKSWQPEVLRLWADDSARLEVPVYNPQRITSSAESPQQDRCKAG